MLIHHLRRETPEHRMTGHHLPEHHAQRVQVRADVQVNSGELLRFSELRCTGKKLRESKSQLQQARWGRASLAQGQ